LLKEWIFTLAGMASASAPAIITTITSIEFTDLATSNVTDLGARL
jgi:hypothetical protein